MDDDDEHPRSSYGIDPLARCMYLDAIDLKISASGDAVSPPAPAPPPRPRAPPALSFEAWAELSVRVLGTSDEEQASTIAAAGLTPEAWRRCESEYNGAIFDDIRAGKPERPALYDAKLKEERARRAGMPVEAAPPAPAPPPGAGTANAPDLTSAIWAANARLPFAPPAPEAPVNGKPRVKTVQSRVAPSSVAGETMNLDGSEPRSTPVLPFEGAGAAPGQAYEPRLNARQFVALSVELGLEPVPRMETLRRYHLPTEAALRAEEAFWRSPQGRALLLQTVDEFAEVLRRRVLGEA